MTADFGPLVRPISGEADLGIRLATLEAWFAHPDRPLSAEDAPLFRELADLRRTLQTHADVILFRASGKYYTEEQWAIPADAIGPSDMDRSPDFRRISDGGAVLVATQEPWGFPHLFPSDTIDGHRSGGTP